MYKNYSYYIERLNQIGDPKVKVSTVPFHGSVYEGTANLQMIRDISFSFLAKEGESYIFRLIAIKKPERWGVNVDLLTADLVEYLTQNRNLILNNQSDVILLKTFKMTVDKEHDCTFPIYEEDGLTVTIWRAPMKGKLYYANPTVIVKTEVLDRLINNFIR